eukprot:CAMPEP_0176244336 /NCGR_PEP_ID=MMETSP0121_2-20121125/31380_1 /TAXON_ID=160619 /ORGANISM="Kryptoperidinium foliaceum, Strain CCMP 1326" /LENGTH=80 /DNA_ID=CAMNT_0017583943 /DNA_START=157 /DNA_END=396 /DNA_ORIENTATION=-
MTRGAEQKPLSSGCRNETRRARAPLHGKQRTKKGSPAPGRDLREGCDEADTGIMSEASSPSGNGLQTPLSREDSTIDLST